MVSSSDDRVVGNVQPDVNMTTHHASTRLTSKRSLLHEAMFAFQDVSIFVRSGECQVYNLYMISLPTILPTADDEIK